MASLFKRERLSAMHRKALLAGQPMSMANNEGPLVCSCFKVGKTASLKPLKLKILRMKTGDCMFKSRRELWFVFT